MGRSAAMLLSGMAGVATETPFGIKILIKQLITVTFHLAYNAILNNSFRIC